MKNTVALILAAGFGKRLRPSTEHCPKPLIPVAGVEPLFYALANAYGFGVRRFVVNTHYLPEQIEERLKEWRLLFDDAEIKSTCESKGILGTGGGIINILQKFPTFFKDSSVLVQNGDTIASIDLSRLLSDPGKNRLAISFWENHLRMYSPLWVDSQKRWIGIGKSSPQKESRAAHFLGNHFLSVEAVRELCRSTFKPIEADLFNSIYRPLANQGHQFLGEEYFQEQENNDEEFWFDMTNQQYLLTAQHHIFSTLKPGSRWAKILEKRYPGITALEDDLWVLMPKRKIELKAPGVFVAPEFENNDFVSGPYSTVLLEKEIKLSGRAESCVLFAPRGSQIQSFDRVMSQKVEIL